MEPIWISLTFAAAFGFIARRLKLPPLIGFLAAGFLLRQFGVRDGELLTRIGDIGITLLLFTIGLKLQVGSLLRPVIWAGTTIHAAVTVAFFSAVFAGFSALGITFFAGTGITTILLVSFALSFSSTVFAVKVFEDKGELNSAHGRAAVGMLIMQDVLAVVFLTLSTGKLPSPYAILVVIALFLSRPLLHRLMDRLDHGEITILFGFFLALVMGAASFEAVHMKSDLGALLIGMLVAKHPRSREIASSLMSFKEIFLVGFFLSIGLTADPTWNSLIVAGVLVLLLPVKMFLFFFILTAFGLRARTGLLASFGLANYSEFGLIVAGAGVTMGVLGVDWLIIIAIALSISFLLASPLNSLSNNIYKKYSNFLLRFERDSAVDDEVSFPDPSARILILGMGRIGAGAYDYLEKQFPGKVCGVEMLSSLVQSHSENGRKAMHADASDPDFWDTMSRLGVLKRLNLVMLAMPRHRTNQFALEQLRSAGYTGKISGIAMYDDQVQNLLDSGADTAFNFYSEAGSGFGEHIHSAYGDDLVSSASR